MVAGIVISTLREKWITLLRSSLAGYGSWPVLSSLIGDNAARFLPISISLYVDGWLVRGLHTLHDHGEWATPMPSNHIPQAQTSYLLVVVSTYFS